MQSENAKFPTSCIGAMADLWANDGVNQKDLGISLIKTKSSINQMLASLESDGMIVKKDDPNDKRGKLIFLTEKGKNLQTYIESASQSADQNLQEIVSQEDIDTTKRVLGILHNMLLQEATATQKQTS